MNKLSKDATEGTLAFWVEYLLFIPSLGASIVLVKYLKSQNISIDDAMLWLCYLPVSLALIARFLNKYGLLSRKSMLFISTPALSLLIVGSFHVMWLDGLS